MFNIDYTALVEAKGDIAILDISRTTGREFPEVSFDKMLDKENLREGFCPSNNQNIVVDESSQPTMENPEVLSDTESDRMDEAIDVLGNVNYVQDAFIFCPVMGKRNEPNGRDKKFSL